MLERGIGAARFKLVGSDLTQQRLESVNHRKADCRADGGGHAHLESGMDVVGVNVVVGDDGHMREPCIVKGLAQQRRVMRQATIADVLARTNRNVGVVVFPAHQRGERFANRHLRREADIVVDVFLSQSDGLLATHVKRFGAHSLAAERGCHQASERMRRVRH